MTPVFETNINNQRFVKAIIQFRCPDPECEGQHEFTFGDRDEWECDCGKTYTVDVAGRVWEPEVEEEAVAEQDTAEHHQARRSGRA